MKQLKNIIMSTLNSKFKKCPNGHYYDASLPSCPYCPKDGSQSVSNGGTQTIGGMNEGNQTIGQMGGGGVLSQLMALQTKPLKPLIFLAIVMVCLELRL